MKCSECGKKIEKDALKCPNCGNVIKGSKYNDYINNYRNNNIKIDFKTIIIIIVVIIVFVILGLVFASNSFKKYSITNTENNTESLEPRNLICTYSINKNNFIDNWEYSFSFKGDKLEKFSKNGGQDVSKLDVSSIPKVVKDTEKLKINDLIGYKSGNTIIIHRIIDIVEDNNKNYFITKGDNEEYQDKNLVSLEDILFQVDESYSFDDLKNMSFKEIKNIWEKLDYSCKEK